MPPTQTELLISSLEQIKALLKHDAREVLKSYDMTFARWDVLHAVYEHGKTSPRALAQRTRIHGPSITRLVRRLVRDKMLRTRVHDSDSRRTEIILTPKGARTHDKIDPLVQSAYTTALSQLGDKKAARLARALT